MEEQGGPRGPGPLHFVDWGGPGPSTFEIQKCKNISLNVHLPDGSLPVGSVGYFTKIFFPVGLACISHLGKFIL